MISVRKHARSLSAFGGNNNSATSNGTANVLQFRRKSVTRKPVTDDAILAAFVERPSVVAVSRKFRVGDLYVCEVLSRYLPVRRTAA